MPPLAWRHHEMPEYLNNINNIYYEKYSLAKKLIDEKLSNKIKVTNRF